MGLPVRNPQSVNVLNRKTTDFTYHGRSFHFTYYENEYLGTEISKTGTFYAVQELELCRPTLSKNHVVIDCGANIGNHSVYYSQYCSKVFAIEPYKPNFELLTINATRNADNIICLNYLLSDIMDQYVPSIGHEDKTDLDNYGNVSYTKGSNGIISSTLDDLFSNIKIDIIKIDTEGMELAVLRGAKRIIQEFHPRLFIESHSQGNYEAIMAFLQECNYKQPRARSTSSLFNHDK